MAKLDGYETWTYPISYFDLEAISYPIPRYNKSRPYQDLPFQFSCHIQRFSEAKLEHHEFLFDQDADPRETFINEMLKTLPAEGSIVVYHQTYEISKLTELAKDFPQYEALINSLLPRIVDLKKVIEASVYHPEFLGSYSIKKVAPVLLGQNVSYDHLAVGDGIEAVCKYQELIQLAYNETSLHKSSAMKLAMETDWDLKEKYNELLASIQSLEKIKLSPRKKAVDKILMYAEDAIKHLSTPV